MSHATSSSRWSQALLAGSILLVIVSLVKPWVPPPLSVLPGTQVTCVAPSWNAGDVFSGQSHRHDFVIANTGRTAVTVRAVTASCGCTTYSPDLIGQRVEAGERLTVPVTWNVAASPGQQLKKVEVHFDEWPEWSLPLQIVGEVKAAYTLSSPQITFGTIAPDASQVQQTTITFADGSPAGRVTSAQCSHDGLSVTVVETDDPRVQTIVARTVPPLAVGRLHASVLLLTKQGSVVVPIVAAVEGETSASIPPRKDSSVN